MADVAEDVNTEPRVPACGSPARERAGFVVTELGSLWRELRRRADRETGDVH